MKNFIISILISIPCLDAHCNESGLTKVEGFSDSYVQQVSNGDGLINVSNSFWSNSSDFCPLLDCPEQSEKSSLNHISTILDVVGNDLIVGLAYGLIVPVSTVIIIAPVVVNFSGYARNPYDRDMPNLLVLFSLSEEQLLHIIRSLRIPGYNSIAKASVIEEIQFRFIALTTIKSHFSYLFEKLEFDNEEIKSKSEMYSVIFSSALFGLAHLSNPNPQIFQVLSATIGGLFFGYIYCGNGILSSITAHMVNNLLAVTIIKLLRWRVLRSST